MSLSAGQQSGGEIITTLATTEIAVAVFVYHRITISSNSMHLYGKSTIQAKVCQEKVRVKIKEEGMRLTLAQLFETCKGAQNLVSQDRQTKSRHVHKEE